MQPWVDIVYTWVDGSDERWQQKREQALLKDTDSSTREIYANVNGRFRDNGELMYSLRSVEKYFPEVRRIYIVTDNQVPSFLDIHHPKIEIVSHEQIIPAGELPTFSSKKIETYFHRIDWIADNFIYLNDDVFLWPNFKITDFFDDIPVYYFGQNTDGFAPWFSDIVASKVKEYRELWLYPMHAPRVVNLESYRIFEHLFSQNIQDVRGEVFRDNRFPSIICDLYSPWMVQTGRWKVGSRQGFYIESCSVDASQDFEWLLDHFATLPFFCINDTCDNLPLDHPSLLRIRKILQILFSEKSSFEQ